MSITTTYTITRATTVAAVTPAYKLDVLTKSGSPLAALAVFAIQVLPASAEGASQSRFSHVCSPADMEQYGTTLDVTQAYYRESHIILYLSSQFQVEQVVNNILSDIAKLSQALAILEDSQLIPDQTHTVVL